MLKSWDIFDTLIARKCVFPRSVFAIVEQVGKVKNFATARIAAEQNLVKQGLNYNLDDIYKELQRIAKAPKELCDGLKNLEIKVELDQCIPITENLRQVKAGDILISDMYLPEKVIRKMLDKAGLFAPVEILVTSGGKASGKVWKEFAEQGQFLFHIGDNVEVDVKKPRQYGFDSALTTLSRPNYFEQWLMQRDFAFGSYLREIRLRNPFTEEIKRTYWTLFTLNVGILIIFVQLIDQLQKKHGFEYLGFCGRDTYYLWLLYKKFKDDLGEEPPANDYLHYSRKLINYSKSNIAKYFDNKIDGRKALMIDLVGTGISLDILRRDLNLDYSTLICGHNNWTKNFGILDWICLLEKKEMPLERSKNFCFTNFNVEEQLLWREPTENLNRATHNSPIRLSAIKINEKILSDVILSPIDDTENFDVIETCLKEFLKSKIVWGGIKNQNVLENLRQMLIILNNWGAPAILKSQHMINENIDRRDFIESFEQRYKVESNSSISVNSFEKNKTDSREYVKGAE